MTSSNYHYSWWLRNDDVIELCNYFSSFLSGLIIKKSPTAWTRDKPTPLHDLLCNIITSSMTHRYYVISVTWFAGNHFSDQKHVLGASLIMIGTWIIHRKSQSSNKKRLSERSFSSFTVRAALHTFKNNLHTFQKPDFLNFRMKEVELHPSQIVKERGTSTRLGCLSRCDGSAVLMSELGSCCVGIIGPVEAKEKDQDPIKMICQVTLHPPSGMYFGEPGR